MGASQIVVFVVALGDASDPTTLAMTASAQDALGADATVIIREEAVLPPDDSAVALETKLHADAIVEVSWPEAGRTRAHLHVHVHRGATAEWNDRDVAFTTGDAPVERGKTLGFAVASMVPVHDVETTPVVPVVEPPVRVVPPIASSAPPHVDAPPPRPAPANPGAGGLDLAVVGSYGVGGEGGGKGILVGGRYRIAGSLSAVVSGITRIGDVAVAQSFTFAFGAGLAWAPLAFGRDDRVTLGARVDFLMTHQSLKATSFSTGETAQGARWLPVFDALLEPTWWFVPDAALVGSVGAEVAAGRTAVVVAGVPTATIPVVRIVGGVGVRIRF